MRASPSGEEWRTLCYMVPVSPQSANLPELQVSSELFPQSLTPGNIAELRGSPPLQGSLERLVRLSPAGALFQDTELAAQVMFRPSIGQITHVFRAGLAEGVPLAISNAASRSLEEPWLHM